MIYRLGQYELDTSLLSLRLGEGVIHVKPKSFRILVHLVEQRDRVVPRQELLEMFWAGTAVTEDVLVQCIGELRRAFDDDARNPIYVKTVHRVGYGYIGPIEVVDSVEHPETERLAAALPNVAGPHAARRAPRSRRNIYVAIAASLAAILGLGASYFRSIAPRPTVVAYFENLTHTPEMDWLSQGLADMTIVGLSRSPGLNVMSRQQFAFSLRDAGGREGKPIRLPEAMDIARRYRAKVLILGTFADLGESIRITAEIHDAATGSTLGVESATAARAGDIVGEMDLLALRLARHLGVPPGEVRTVREPGALGSENLQAYRLYSLGIESANSYHRNEALDLLRKAVELDPDFAMAQARIGYTYSVTWGTEPELGLPYLEKAFRLSGHLSAKDRLRIAAWYAVANRDYRDAVRRYRELTVVEPDDPENYVRLGHLLRGEEQQDEAIAVLEKGLILNPRHPDLINALGAMWSQKGEHERALALEQKYVEILPGEPNAYDSLGLAQLWAGQFDEAESSFRHALSLKPDFDVAARHLMTLYYRSGRYRDALRAVELARTIAPSPRDLSSIVMGSVYTNLARHDVAAARRSWSEISATSPGWNSGQWLLALAEGNRSEAERLSTATLAERKYTHRGTRPPVQREYHCLKGKLALLQGRPEEAVKSFREAVRHWPGWADTDVYEECLGDGYLEIGRLDEAITEYRRVLARFPGTAGARFGLGKAYERKGDRSTARREYLAFRELWKHADADAVRTVEARAGSL